MQAIIVWTIIVIIIFITYFGKHSWGPENSAKVQQNASRTYIMQNMLLDFMQNVINQSVV